MFMPQIIVFVLSFKNGRTNSMDAHDAILGSLFAYISLTDHRALIVN